VNIVTLEEYLFVDPSPIADLYSTASLRPIASPRWVVCPHHIVDPGLNVGLFACLFAFSRRPSWLSPPVLNLSRIAGTGERAVKILLPTLATAMRPKPDFL
jgi:hypothetical protein